MHFAGAQGWIEDIKGGDSQHRRSWSFDASWLDVREVVAKIDRLRLQDKARSTLYWSIKTSQWQITWQFRGHFPGGTTFLVYPAIVSVSAYSGKSWDRRFPKNSREESRDRCQDEVITEDRVRLRYWYCQDHTIVPLLLPAKSNFHSESEACETWRKMFRSWKRRSRIFNSGLADFACSTRSVSVWLPASCHESMKANSPFFPNTLLLGFSMPPWCVRLGVGGSSGANLCLRIRHDKCKQTSIKSRRTNGQTNAKKALRTPSRKTTLGEKREDAESVVGKNHQMQTRNHLGPKHWNECTEDKHARWGPTIPLKRGHYHLENNAATQMVCWNEASHPFVSPIISVSDCILSWLVDFFFFAHLLVTYYSTWLVYFEIYAAVIFGDVWVKDFWRARRPVKRREPEPCMPVAKSSAQGFENNLQLRQWSLQERGSLISQYMSPAREARGMVADGLYWKDQLSQATSAVFAVSFVWLWACNTVPFWTRAWASSEDISKSKHQWPSVLSLQLGRLIQTFSIADFPKFVKCFRMPWWYCSCCSLLASRLLCLDPVSWPWVRTKLWRSLARGTDSTSLL